MSSNHFLKWAVIYATIALIPDSGCIWPRPFKVHLEERKTFELSEEISSDDEDDIYDPNDEMIKDSDLDHFDLRQDDDKHYRIHQMVVRRNKKAQEEAKQSEEQSFRVKETNLYEDPDPEPYEGRFVDDNGRPLTREVYKFDQVAKRMINNDTNEEEDYLSEDYDPNYDYGHLKAEYDAQEKKVALSNNTFNYTDVKEEESVDDAVKAVMDFKEPKNCTKEELTGIGFNAAKCFMHELNTKESAKQRASLMRRIVKYLIIWFAVYVFIAIPCWCQNGWCCCCCICKTCYPHERIDEVKAFIARNPVGIYHENGIEFKYKPSPFERYAQQKLEKRIMKL